MTAAQAQIRAPSGTRIQRGGPTSIYIDLIRAMSVMLVFISHTQHHHFGDGFLGLLGHFGQEAVATFFVLSGLVVADATFSRSGDFVGYLGARLSRLWSVALPAIVLTVLLDTVGWHLAPALYQGGMVPGWQFDAASVWRAISPALFLNSTPPLNVDVGTNGPFWSLAEEAWYYLGFGVAVFMRGWPRMVVLVFVAGMAGPMARCLAPIWLLGVLLRPMLGQGVGRGVARADKKTNWPIGREVFWTVAWLLTVAAAVLLLAGKWRLIAVLDAVMPQTGIENLTNAVIVEKYGVAVLAALNILCFDRIANGFRAMADRIKPMLDAFVARSFSVYLYQAPLLYFIAALWMRFDTKGRNTNLRVISMYVGGIGLSMLLAEATERRPWVRQVMLPWLRRGLVPFRGPAGAGQTGPR